MAASNRMQDLTLEAMDPGRTGNEALAAMLTKMKAEGINGSLYSHPIGDHGHGAGPLIGLWDRQEGVPGRGDAKIRPSTWFSIELQATVPDPGVGRQERVVPPGGGGIPGPERRPPLGVPAAGPLPPGVVS